jgi:hypothetical protein
MHIFLPNVTTNFLDPKLSTANAAFIWVFIIIIIIIIIIILIIINLLLLLLLLLLVYYYYYYHHHHHYLIYGGYLYTYSWDKQCP